MATENGIIEKLNKAIKDVKDAYKALGDKGVTIPSNQTTGNLANCIKDGVKNTNLSSLKVSINTEQIISKNGNYSYKESAEGNNGFSDVTVNVNINTKSINETVDVTDISSFKRSAMENSYYDKVDLTFKNDFESDYELGVESLNYMAENHSSGPNGDGDSHKFYIQYPQIYRCPIQFKIKNTVGMIETSEVYGYIENDQNIYEYDVLGSQDQLFNTCPVLTLQLSAILSNLFPRYIDIIHDAENGEVGAIVSFDFIDYTGNEPPTGRHMCIPSKLLILPGTKKIYRETNIWDFNFRSDSETNGKVNYINTLHNDLMGGLLSLKSLTSGGNILLKSAGLQIGSTIITEITGYRIFYNISVTPIFDDPSKYYDQGLYSSTSHHYYTESTPTFIGTELIDGGEETQVENHMLNFSNFMSQIHPTTAEKCSIEKWMEMPASRITSNLSGIFTDRSGDGTINGGDNGVDIRPRN